MIDSQMVGQGSNDNDDQAQTLNLTRHSSYVLQEVDCDTFFFGSGAALIMTIVTVLDE